MKIRIDDEGIVIDDEIRLSRADQNKEPDASVKIRPVFKRTKTVARSIRLDRNLLNAAGQAAKKDWVRTGGHVNGLIELLLWEYLGRDSRFVE